MAGLGLVGWYFVGYPPRFPVHIGSFAHSNFVGAIAKLYDSLLFAFPLLRKFWCQLFFSSFLVPTAAKTSEIEARIEEK